MPAQKDSSVGIVPVYTESDGMQSFCIVHHAAGHWAFPKGHQDAAESQTAAARRELYEETGILTCKLDGARTFTEKYSFEKDGVRYDKEVTYFVGFVDEKADVGPIEAFKAEISEARWVSDHEAKELLSFPEGIKIMEEVCEYLRARA